jgi:hypothetical protein
MATGLIIAAVGALFIGWSRTRSKYVVYRILVARSRLLWGDNVHRFFLVAGALMVAFGAFHAIRS